MNNMLWKLKVSKDIWMLSLTVRWLTLRVRVLLALRSLKTVVLRKLDEMLSGTYHR